MLDQSLAANALEGEWLIGATNIDQWSNGSRRDAHFSFTVDQESPLVVSEVQTYTGKDGKERRVALTSRFANGEFIARGRRLSTTMSRWSIGGIDRDRGILLVRLTHTRGGQDGLIVLVRKMAGLEELRAIIATHAGEFGIGPEDFASLSWLPVP